MWRWEGTPRRQEVVMDPLWAWQEDPERRGKKEEVGMMKEEVGNMKEKSKLESGMFARKDYVPFNR